MPINCGELCFAQKIHWRNRSKTCISMQNHFRWSLDNQWCPFEMSAFAKSDHSTTLIFNAVMGSNRPGGSSQVQRHRNGVPFLGGRSHVSRCGLLSSLQILHRAPWTVFNRGRDAANLSYDPKHHDPRGRMYYVKAKYGF